MRTLWSALALAILFNCSAFAQHYTRTDLTADSAATSASAANIDAHLQNAWGMSRSSGSPWWVADNGTAVSTLYNATGVPQPATPLVVNIPGTNGAPGHPTGTVFNYSSGFEVAPGVKAIFMFVTVEGTISGWNPGVKPTDAVLTVDRSGKAVYTGCTLATTKFGTFLYAANFKTGQIEVYDSKFQRVFGFGFGFHDERLSRSFVPFNIQNVGGNLVVAFAKKERGGDEEQHGPGLGAVAIFNPFGRLLQRLDRGPFLNARWGITQAPSDFGVFSHRLLVGNFGDGKINAFNPVSGDFEGTLLDPGGAPLAIDGLWAISFGSNGTAGSAIEMYFAAGPNDEVGGLLGKIVPVAAEQRGNNE